jgi:hypothetical protein
MSWQTLQNEWAATAEIQPESGENWILEYFLQEIQNEEGEKFYGLRIDKNTPEGMLYEREETPAITDSREEALRMAKAFARGSVTPATLLEMADEWVSENLAFA